MKPKHKYRWDGSHWVLSSGVFAGMIRIKRPCE
jgi:hypothetical protein